MSLHHPFGTEKGANPALPLLKAHSRQKGATQMTRSSFSEAGLLKSVSKHSTSRGMGS